MAVLRRFIMIVDFDNPHLTGLVFEVRFVRSDGSYAVVPVCSKDGTQLSADIYGKQLSFEVDTCGSENYWETMLERTRLILEYQADK